MSGKGKSYEELVVTISGLVKGVIGKSMSMSHTPASEMMIGGSSPAYDTGYKNSLEIDFLPEDKEIPVRKLIFNGNSPIIAGNNIVAYIFAGTTERVPY